MDKFVRLKLEKEIPLDDFLQFLDFHQFQYKVSDEEIIDFYSLSKENDRQLLIPEENFEEFKVMVLIYKDLLANKDQRSLNIPIENSIIDYEKTRKINREELFEQAEPIADEIFVKANEGEIPEVKDMEDSFYGYKKKKKDRELKAKTVKTVIKEIRFGPNTDEHDFEFKVKHARNFLGEGAKVRAYVQFRGRSIVFQDRGELLLLKFMKELEEFGTAEALPKLEGKRMGVLISPKKKK